MQENAPLPLLVVFGLDFTLWPFSIALLESPFEIDQSGEIIDVKGRTFRLYEDVPKIFDDIKNKSIKIAITSRTNDVNGTLQMLDLLNWKEYVSIVEVDNIYDFPDKINQFKGIHVKSKIDYSDMLFFDDVHGNVHDAHRLGMCGVWVGLKGIKYQTYVNGLKEFALKKLNPDYEMEMYTDIVPSSTITFYK